MENKFSIGGRSFTLSKLDAFKQFHIVRRIGPILIDLLPRLKQIQNIKAESEEQQVEHLAQFAGPVLSGLSKLSDADADYVLHNLLSCVEVQQSHGNWAAVFANGMMMINDMDFPVLIQVAARSFMFNLSGFFSALPQ